MTLDFEPARVYNAVFERSVIDYHQIDDVDALMPSTCGSSFKRLLYEKNWIDTVQWHLEDKIRDPLIDPYLALQIKRRIDASNQARTDIVERIDDALVGALARFNALSTARLNSETPAWLLDRMSILMLKIYHMKEQMDGTDATPEHKLRCQQKYHVLEEQKQDMELAFDQLIEDVRNGIRRVKIYRQMKMYNDPTLNPILKQNPLEFIK